MRANRGGGKGEVQRWGHECSRELTAVPGERKTEAAGIVSVAPRNHARMISI